MQVIVTGATGFLGSCVCKRLYREGYDVSGLGRQLSRASDLKRLGVSVKSCDIVNAEAVKRHIKKDSIVVHCAALSSLWGPYDDFYKANVLGTRNIVSACVSNRVMKLIHISTPSIYCSSSNQLDIKENSELPVKQINYYSETKLQAEVELEPAKRVMEVVVLRPQSIFGIGDRSIFPRLLYANTRVGVPFIDGGKSVLDITHVENVVTAICQALKIDNLGGKIYNITNDEPVVFEYLVRELFDKMGIKLKTRRVTFGQAMLVANLLEFGTKVLRLKSEPLLTRSSVCLIGKSRTLNIDAAKKDLQYQCKVNLWDGIEEFTAYARGRTA